jgi:hypothetical protein
MLISAEKFHAEAQRRTQSTQRNEFAAYTLRVFEKPDSKQRSFSYSSNCLLGAFAIMCRVLSGLFTLLPSRGIFFPPKGAKENAKENVCCVQTLYNKTTTRQY